MLRYARNDKAKSHTMTERKGNDAASHHEQVLTCAAIHNSPQFEGIARFYEIAGILTLFEHSSCKFFCLDFFCLAFE
ncbi:MULTISPECIES: hypothetical protein [Helicobacter]|uniref:hypothetical protein n=1 Tax=Helicobacter TaxID=209 RepID=UPI00262F1CCE|nr:hypothetical protein [Helicobacter sp. UBA3407]